ncbi:valine--tRNA ligase [Alphaproteobacteria bacterium HT1-32]|nr:valine--tRNA ligase [Alphaproteobacteria bacterium HT1-32]
MLDKTFRPDEVERAHYSDWESNGLFKATTNANADPYTIVIPPPNVTGSLHMGHALNNTLQDVLIRVHRMQGRNTLWQPGTDHAGIATQMVVERQLGEQGVTRHDLGRDAFISKVWDWKAESGGTITQQLRRLGASCDWSRERFTMDDGLSDAVKKVFVTLHKKGLIYRDKRLVNWDPKLHTAISDLEVEQREVAGKLWHFRYPIEGREGEFITVATTRPETMLGDTGVAVHPEDERYQSLIGKYCIQPITGQRLLIVGDDYADPEQGSGAVKMTPAHDFNDFEVGKRHKLEMINIFDADAHVNEDAPEGYRGLDRFVARDKIIAEMDALGLLEKIDEHPHTVPHGDRSGVPVEPWLTDQWFVNAEVLARPAIEAVEQGRTKIVPKQWEATYYDWMRNIQPWCISRQIWWGHRIPAWYAEDGTIFVEETEEAALEAAAAHFGRDVELSQDTDVLDTWFSSALWPFSTLGWPEQTPELDRFYPTDVLVTGFDILFFWVARMMMMGIEFMGTEPFHTVYLHGLVRDENGQKMSKSKGNVIDPLSLIDKYGADALRFTLCTMEVQGRDVKLSEKRVEGYRNFSTKLWNAARFCQMNECRNVEGFRPAEVTQTVNRWIISEVVRTTAQVNRAVAAYRFNDIADTVYHFAWHNFCDWYLELIKPVLQGDDSPEKAECQATAAWALDQILLLLHPVMPFITSELWSSMGEGREALMSQQWPEYPDSMVDAAAIDDVEWVIRVISAIRGVRSEMNIKPGAKIPLLVKDASETSLRRLEQLAEPLQRLARLESVDSSVTEAPQGAVQQVVDEATYMLPVAEVIDISGEQSRLEKEISRLDGEIDRFDKKLNNENFTSRAPAEVVAEQQTKRDAAIVQREKVQEALERIAGL